MITISQSCSPKVAPKYYCEKCDYSTCKKSSWNKHVLSRKHVDANIMLNNDKNANKKVARQQRHYVCSHCDTKYNHPSSLARHKKSCQKLLLSTETVISAEPVAKSDKDETIKEMKDMIFTLINHNKDMQGTIMEQSNTIIELSKNVGGGVNNSHNNNTTNTNSHNKTFNLQFFLNETCKDAMNITDFVNSLKLTLSDLEKVGELGYAEGISRVFIKGLNDLDVTKRPIHCSDLKREVLHIKDQDKWEKDDNKEILTKAIKDVSTKNLMLMSDWQKENPGCTEYNHGKNDMYLKLMSTSVGPLDEQGEKRDFGKIMRTVAKTTIIDK